MLSLLGTPRFADGPVPLERVTYLLALLACREEWISRDELVLLLWGDVIESAGRQRLRQLLYRARSFAHADGLEADATRVRLVGSSDVRLFRSALRDQRLEDATLFYGGELLQGVQLPDHPELEEFFASEREELASQYRRAVLSSSGSLEPTRALAMLERAVSLDPSSDELVLEGLRCAAGVDAALGQRLYDLHARALRSLGLEPHLELRGLLGGASVAGRALEAARADHGLRRASTRVARDRRALPASWRAFTDDPRARRGGQNPARAGSRGASRAANARWRGFRGAGSD